MNTIIWPPKPKFLAPPLVVTDVHHFPKVNCRTLPYALKVKLS